MKGVIQLNIPLNLEMRRRLWEAVTNHYDCVDSRILLFQQISDNPIEWAKNRIQELHGDLLLMANNGAQVRPESIQSASMAARVLEVVTGEDVPRRYQGTKWRSWD